MRTRFLFSLVLSVLAGHAAGIAIDPIDGSISGTPGESLGWSFTVTADATEWISFVTSFTIDETNPSVGFYTDFIGAEGGPTNFVLAFGAPDWTQVFDDVMQTGLGVFAIDQGAVVGSVDSGNIRILYSAYDEDPNSCEGCSGTPGSFDVPFAVAVVDVSDAPEPGVYLLTGMGLAALSVLRRRRDQGRATQRLRIGTPVGKRRIPSTSIFIMSSAGRRTCSRLGSMKRREPADAEASTLSRVSPDAR